MDMAEVKAFNAELSALYDNRPPISKAKMGAITRGAIKAIKFYKHVVHSVEKFILKCKPEYKIPGLYVIDSIVRQSRHQFGADKDVFAPRFAKNMQQTFVNLLRCPPEDKRNIIRVLNLWQKNSVFSPEVIQPLFDMADPNHPIHQELSSQQPTNGSIISGNLESKNSPMVTANTPNMTQSTEQMRQMLRNHDSSSTTMPSTQSQVNFNRRLLNDFEYESEDDGAACDSSPSISRSIPPAPVSSQSSSMPIQNTNSNNNFLMNVNNLHPQDAIGSILANPEILRQLQSLQSLQSQFMTNFPMQQNNINMAQDVNFIDTSQPPPNIHKIEEPSVSGTSPLLDEVNNESDIEFVDDAGPQVIEIDGNDSRSPSPRGGRRRRSRSRDNSRRSRSRSRRNSRSRSRDRRRRSRDRSRDRSTRDRPRDRERDKEREKEREREREKERERRKKGLPPIKRDTLSVCSTTLWVGHLSKLVQAEELSDAFGAIGDIITIDLVPPRGCAFIVMNRRRDASRAIAKLNKHKMHGKAITVAWAPGKGVKGREWKDFWEADLGACYIPWGRLPSGPNDGEGLKVLDVLEEGGVLDEETVPSWLQRKILEKKLMPDHLMAPGVVAANQSGMMVMSPLQPPQSMGVDTTCLPPPLASLGYAPHPALSMPLPLLGFKPSPQPGLTQALHLQAVIAQQQQLATQLLLAPPSRLSTHPPHPPHPLAAMGAPLQSTLSVMNTHQDDAMDIETAEDSHPESLGKSDILKQSSMSDDSQISEKLKALVSNPPPTFNVPPPALPGQGLLMKPPLLSSQPFPISSLPPPSFFSSPSDQNNSLIQNNNGNNLQSNDIDKDSKRERENIRKDRERRDRNRDKDRHNKERDHDRERDRDRDRDRNDRDRDRERSEKDRDRAIDKDRERPDRERDRPGRERNSRWSVRDRRGSRERSPIVPRHGSCLNNVNERTLQDRLWEMANGPGPRPQQHMRSPQRSIRNDRPMNKDSHGGDSLLGDGPSDLDRRKLLHNNSRVPSPGNIIGVSGPVGMSMGPIGPNCPVGPNGPIGPIGGMGMIGPNIPMIGRSPLPPMAPFRIGREDMRIRGLGPRGHIMRPGMWMEGPGQFGPRFNGGPPFSRPPYDGSSFERQFDGPAYERPSFNRSHFDDSRFDGHSDGYFDRSILRGPRGIRGAEGRRIRGDRDNDRPVRGSRWTENDNSEKLSEKCNNVESKVAELETNSKDEELKLKTVDESSHNESIENNTDFEVVPGNSIDDAMEPDVSHALDENVEESNCDKSSTVHIDETLALNSTDDLPENTESSEGRGTPCRDEPPLLPDLSQQPEETRPGIQVE